MPHIEGEVFAKGASQIKEIDERFFKHSSAQEVRVRKGSGVEFLVHALDGPNSKTGFFHFQQVEETLVKSDSSKNESEEQKKDIKKENLIGK